MRNRKLLIASLALGIFWVSSCGSSSTNSDDATTTIGVTNADSESSDEIEVDKGLLSVEIRLPLCTFADGTDCDVAKITEEELQASVDEDDFDIDVTINSDNTVSYRMSRGEYDRFMKKLKGDVDKAIQETINTEANIYKSVTYSDDLREFKAVVNRSEYENSFSLFNFGITIFAGLYQSFAGQGESNSYVMIRYVDEQTNEEFDTYDSRKDEG